MDEYSAWSTSEPMVAVLRRRAHVAWCAPRNGRPCARLITPLNHGDYVRSKLLTFGLIFPVILVADLATKRWALESLADRTGELLGGLVPLTLAFNRGAAFGIRIGEDSRWFFIPVTLIALGLLAVLFKQAAERDFLRTVSISLVVAGAIGNLWDRVRWDRGVVDFIGPIDLGPWNFPIFNVADSAITCGAVMLAVSFWLEERALERAAEASQAATQELSPEVNVPDELGGETPSN